MLKHSKRVKVFIQKRKTKLFLFCVWMWTYIMGHVSPSTLMNTSVNFLASTYLHTCRYVYVSQHSMFEFFFSFLLTLNLWRRWMFWWGSRGVAQGKICGSAFSANSLNWTEFNIIESKLSITKCNIPWQNDHPSSIHHQISIVKKIQKIQKFFLTIAFNKVFPLSLLLLKSVKSRLSYE